MSELDDTEARGEPSLTLAELASRQHAEPVADPAEFDKLLDAAAYERFISEETGA